MLPAVGQGAIGVECRADDPIRELLAAIDHAPTSRCVGAERAMLDALDGSCHTPIAGYAVIEKRPHAAVRPGAAAGRQPHARDRADGRRRPTASASAAMSARSCDRGRGQGSSTDRHSETPLRILITRPIAEAQALARRLEADGHAVSIEPLLTIEPLPAALDLSGVQAVALTSANAAPSLAAATHLPVFAVGGASAAAARAAGCTRVETAGGDAASLARLIVAACRPDGGAILHPSGSEVRPGLAEALGDAGFAVRRQTVYLARPAQALSARAQAALRAGNRRRPAVLAAHRL